MWKLQVISLTKLYLAGKKLELNYTQQQVAGQWMMETGKRAPELVFKMGVIIIALMTIYDEITDILEELICGCYCDDVESVTEAIMTKNTTICKNMTIAKNY